MKTTASGDTSILLASLIHLAVDINPAIEFNRDDEGMWAEVCWGHNGKTSRSMRCSTFQEALLSCLRLLDRRFESHPNAANESVKQTAMSLERFANRSGFKNCNQLLEAHDGRFVLRICRKRDDQWELMPTNK